MNRTLLALFAVALSIGLTACSASEKGDSSDDVEQYAGKFLCRPTAPDKVGNLDDSFKHNPDLQELKSDNNLITSRPLVSTFSAANALTLCDVAHSNPTEIRATTKDINEQISSEDNSFKKFATKSIHAVDILEYIGPGSLSASVGSSSLAAGEAKKYMKDLRRTLGRNLSMGTDSSQELSVDETWVTQMCKVGRTLVWFQGGKKPASEDLPTKPEGKGEDFYGWVSLAPLLRDGDFDPEFLSKVAVDVIEFDQDLPDKKRKFWESDGQFDNEGAKDPVEPVLAALKADTDALKLVDNELDDPRIDKLVAKQ